jgi:hypothetical protein
MRLFISCARNIALQSLKETRTRVVGRSLGAKPQATEIVALCTPWLVTQDLTCELISPITR